jgi:hypothetical protein
MRPRGRLFAARPGVLRLDRMATNDPTPANARPVFDRVADNIWTTQRPQKFWGVETGTRMSIVKLSDGGLFVHGPVAIDEATRSAVDALGEVRAVVSSSLYHHLYAGDWMKAYPRATFCASPGLEKKRADLAWNHIMNNTPHEIWAKDLDQVYFSSRFEHEVVFFHRATRTFICLDALLNLSTHPKFTTRLVARLMWNNAPGKGYLERIAVGHRATARREVRRILEWDFDGVILAHGGLVPRDGHRVFREAYAWLGA